VPRYHPALDSDVTDLAHVGEFGFIDEIEKLTHGVRTRGVSVGIGDDAAVVACSPTTLLTTDTQRQGVHFQLDWLSARQIGRRAFRVAVSDVSAMGGKPRYVLLSLGAPARTNAGWARRMIGGLIADAQGCGAALVGGNVSADDKVSLVVTVIGDGPRRPLLRSGAKPGDAIWVTGPLGGAAAAIELLRRRVRQNPLIAYYRTPPLRLAVAGALSRAGVVSSMIDVSDGLAQDLGHVCEASGVSAHLALEAVPVPPALLRAAGSRSARSSRGESSSEKKSHGRDPSGASLSHDALSYALSGGDDYELVFTTPERVAERDVRALCARHDCVATRIGTIARGETVVTDGSGSPLDGRGYTHFGASS
jgi:thiamine-monophosphate kinase